MAVRRKRVGRPGYCWDGRRRKLRYLTLGAAQLALLDVQNHRHDAGRTEGVESGIYFHARCNGWHLTSHLLD